MNLPAHDPEALLATDRSLRALARALVFDEQRADDVVQQAWVAALASGPIRPGALRAWLGGVVRNLARRARRTDARTRAREERGARPEALPSTADLAALESARRRVMAEVLELEEPYRSAIALRYFEDLEVAEVAERLGVPLETARTRLKRALARLRGRLDRSHGESWTLALGPLVAPRPSPVPVLLMTTQAKVAVSAAAILLGLSLVWWSLSSQGDAPPAKRESSSAIVAAGAPGTPAVAALAATAPNDGARRAAPLEETTAKKDSERLLSGLTGRVIDTERTPIAQAPVELLGGYGEILRTDFAALLFRPAGVRLSLEKGRTVTDAEGRFRFAAFDPGEAYLVGVNLGRPRPHLRFVDAMPAPGATVDLGDLVLSKPRAISGRVVSRGGSPVAGARVAATTLPSPLVRAGLTEIGEIDLVLGRLDRSPWAAFEKPAGVDALAAKLPVVRATTDASGAFRIEGIPDGAATLVVAAAGFAESVVGPIPEGAEKDLGELSLDAGSAIEGVVVDETGHPFAGAEVVAATPIPLPMLSERLALVRRSARTGSDGRFSIAALSGNDAILAVRPDGWADRTVGERVALDGDPIRFVVPARGRILVTTVDGAGKPVAAEISVRRSGLPIPLGPPIEKPLSARIETKSPGTATIEGLVKGRYRVAAKAEGLTLKEDEVALESGGQAELLLTLGPERLLRLAISGGAPVEGASATAFATRDFPRLGLRALAGGLSDAAGKLTVGIPDGARSLDLVVKHPAYAPATLKLEAPIPEELAVTLTEGGTIEGSVARGGSPPGSPLMVVLESQGPSRDLPRTTVTDARGAFRFAHTEPGRWRVSACLRFLGDDLGVVLRSIFAQREIRSSGADGGVDFRPLATAMVEVRDGEATEAMLELAADDGRDASGESELTGVVTLDGSPLAGVRVTDMERARKSTKTDSSGRYVLGPLKAGTHDIEFVEGGRVRAVRRAVVRRDRENRLDLRLTTAAPLRGTVVSARDGAPIAEATLEAYRHDVISDPSSAISYALEEGEAVSGADGTFEIRRLTPGQHSLVVRAAGFATRRSLLTLGAQALAPITVRLEASFDLTGTVDLGGAEMPGKLSLGFRRHELLAPADWEQDASVLQEPVAIDAVTRSFTARGLAPGTYEIVLSAMSDPAKAGPTWERIPFKPIELTVDASTKPPVVLRFTSSK